MIAPHSSGLLIGCDQLEIVAQIWLETVGTSSWRTRNRFRMGGSHSRCHRLLLALLCSWQILLGQTFALEVSYSSASRNYAWGPQLENTSWHQPKVCVIWFLTARLCMSRPFCCDILRSLEPKIRRELANVRRRYQMQRAEVSGTVCGDGAGAPFETAQTCVELQNHHTKVTGLSHDCDRVFLGRGFNDVSRMFDIIVILGLYSLIQLGVAAAPWRGQVALLHLPRALPHHPASDSGDLCGTLPCPGAYCGFKPWSSRLEVFKKSHKKGDV